MYQQGGANGTLVSPPVDMLNIPQRPAPTPPQAAGQQVTIPDLPPSLPCKTEWLAGLWLQTQAFESPLGKETELFKQNPMQYIGFSKDSRLYRYNSGKTYTDPKVVLDLVTNHSGALVQYLLQDTGMLYFYQDSVAIDSQVCFIVAETHPPYAAGNLILMPPKGTIQGRLIKLYRKVWPPKTAPAKPAPGPAPGPAPTRPQVRYYNQH